MGLDFEIVYNREHGKYFDVGGYTDSDYVNDKIGQEFTSNYVFLSSVVASA